MKITTQYGTSGCHVRIQTKDTDLSVRTENGTPEELLTRADEMRQQAIRLNRRASLIEQAAQEMKE